MQFKRKIGEDRGQQHSPERQAATVSVLHHASANLRPDAGLPPRAVLDAAMKIVGSLQADGDVQVDAKIDGDVRCRQLTIGKCGMISGDITAEADLRRAGIPEAASAIVFPAAGTNEADMRSILCVMAIESIAPEVRTVVEVNNPAHVEHFRRAKADEIMVTSRIASRLLARSSLYPGLAELVTDIVSGGEGSELYRVNLPDSYTGHSIDELSTKLRAEHSATLLAIGRGGRAFVNPPPDFRLEIGDDALVVAESLGTLEPMDADYTETA